MYCSLRQKSHRRMVIRTLKNRKAIINLHQEFADDETFREYKSFIAKPNRNMNRPKKMDFPDEVTGTINSSGWKVSTRRKRQWKSPRPSQLF